MRCPGDGCRSQVDRVPGRYRVGVVGSSPRWMSTWCAHRRIRPWRSACWPSAMPPSWLDTHHPEVVAIEQVFSQLNVTTVMGTAQAGGVIALAAARPNVVSTCISIPPARSRRRSLAQSRRQGTGHPVVAKYLRCKNEPTPADAAGNWRWRSVTVGGRRRSPGWLRPRRGRKHGSAAARLMRTSQAGGRPMIASVRGEGSRGGA